MTSRTPSILKQRSVAPVKLSFQCNAELADRLVKLEQTAKQVGLQIDIDAALEATLARLIAAAEKELGPAVREESGGQGAQAEPALPDTVRSFGLEEQQGDGARD